MPTSNHLEAQRQHQIEVLQDMTALLDSLTDPEQKREVLSFLATRTGGRIFFSENLSRGSYGPAYKRRTT